MNIEKIKQADTKILGKEIEYYQEITSTHLVAKERAEREAMGKMILAEIQTDGIGTKGRKWYTGSGKNIAMTIITKPNCEISKLEGFTTKIAQCMKKTIYDLYGYDLKIKEPNDLLLKEKKICGILTEINTMGGKIKYLLISLGFNVNEDVFSEETNKIATSLKKEYGEDFSREDIIIHFMELLEKEIEW